MAASEEAKDNQLGGVGGGGVVASSRGRARTRKAELAGVLGL